MKIQKKNKNFIIDQCTQSVEVGPCEGEFTRFYYDTITGQCRSFIYGGCKKNKNNFLTLKDCLKTCVEPRQKGKNTDNVLMLFVFLMIIIQRYVFTTKSYWYMSRTSTNLVF